MNIRKWTLASAIAMVMSGCAASDKAAVAPAASAPATTAPSAPISNAPSLNGWYLQGAGGSRLQPCGQSVQWLIGDKADLQAK